MRTKLAHFRVQSGGKPTWYTHTEQAAAPHPRSSLWPFPRKNGGRGRARAATIAHGPSRRLGYVAEFQRWDGAVRCATAPYISAAMRRVR